jgi:hypothetical protein
VHHTLWMISVITDFKVNNCRELSPAWDTSLAETLNYNSLKLAYFTISRRPRSAKQCNATSSNLAAICRICVQHCPAASQSSRAGRRRSLRAKSLSFCQSLRGSGQCPRDHHRSSESSVHVHRMDIDIMFVRQNLDDSGLLRGKIGRGRKTNKSQ